MNSPHFPSTKTALLKNPSYSLDQVDTKYTPVDCDFTDELEYVAVKKIIVEVTHVTSKSERRHSVGLIKDIVTSNQEEHVILSNDEQIRLDRIEQVKIMG